MFEIIKTSEASGCHVDAVISDMRPSNKALWKQYGTSAKRFMEPTVSCKHPSADSGERQLYFLTDAPHVLKNIRGHLVWGQSFFLLSDVVAKNDLPTHQVRYNYTREIHQMC